MANILLVDDDDLLVYAQSEFLHRAGPTASTAVNGNVAMDLVAANDFDLVITDINMPEKEGLETIAALRRISTVSKLLAIGGFFLQTDENMPVKGSIMDS